MPSGVGVMQEIHGILIPKMILEKKKGHLKFVGIGHNCVAPFLSLVYPAAFPSLFHYMGQVCLFLNLVSCGLCVCDDHGFHWLVSTVGNVA